MDEMHTNLESVTDVDVKRGRVSWHGDPHGAIIGRRRGGWKQYLQAVGVVRPENAQDLRVGVLPEADPILCAALGVLGQFHIILRPVQARGWVVIQPNQGVIVTVLE